jgi:hypothetical protein
MTSATITNKVVISIPAYGDVNSKEAYAIMFISLLMNATPYFCLLANIILINLKAKLNMSKSQLLQRKIKYFYIIGISWVIVDCETRSITSVVVVIW